MADHIEDIGHNSRMTPDEYRREREAIRGDEIRVEQRLALLFARSNWDDEEIARIEGCSARRIRQLLLLGQFLNFGTTVPNSEKALEKLTEGRFREEYAKTGNRKLNQRQRFERILKALIDPPPEGKVHAAPIRQDPTPANKLGRAIRDQFSDGKWHKAAVIADAVGAEIKDVRARLETWAGDVLTSATVETRKDGKSIEVRIFAKKHSVSLIQIKEKLSPLIKQLREEAGKSEARISRATLGMIASQLLKLIDQWESSSESGRGN